MHLSVVLEQSYYRGKMTAQRDPSHTPAGVSSPPNGTTIQVDWNFLHLNGQ
ncbi:hypothetical protein DPMN_120520 [Dreissena polymorpha]|uniref:Uncharacterized protein n=1 Tax=Dreissena polymorpha TaxID=45954 RepID=A0A9D4JQ81_DREPO|nr:hypothetical protein DPMN_120520 [Dreissena polymorpha]